MAYANYPQNQSNQYNHLDCDSDDPMKIEEQFNHQFQSSHTNHLIDEAYGNCDNKEVSSPNKIICSCQFHSGEASPNEFTGINLDQKRLLEHREIIAHHNRLLLAAKPHSNSITTSNPQDTSNKTTGVQQWIDNSNFDDSQQLQQKVTSTPPSKEEKTVNTSSFLSKMASFGNHQNDNVVANLYPHKKGCNFPLLSRKEKKRQHKCRCFPIPGAGHTMYVTEEEYMFTQISSNDTGVPQPTQNSQTSYGNILVNRITKFGEMLTGKDQRNSYDANKYSHSNALPAVTEMGAVASASAMKRIPFRESPASPQEKVS